MSEGHAMQEIDRLFQFIKESFPVEAALIGTQNGTGPIEPVDVAIKLLGRVIAARAPKCGRVRDGAVCDKLAVESIYIEKAGRVGDPGDRNSIFVCADHAQAAKDEFRAAWYSISVRPIAAAT